MVHKKIKCNPRKKGNICRGVKGKRKTKCEFGVNKRTGDCLKYPRKKK